MARSLVNVNYRFFDLLYTIFCNEGNTISIHNNKSKLKKTVHNSTNLPAFHYIYSV